MRTMQSKVCFKCQVNKPHKFFCKNANNKDGLNGLCRECKQKARLRFPSHQKRKIYQKKWYKNGGKETVRKNSLAWQKLHKKWLLIPKIQRIAYAKVQTALRNGTLKKPRTCSECKSTKQIEGHHADYNKPLKVKWLCHICHRLNHVFELRKSAIEELQ